MTATIHDIREFDPETENLKECSKCCRALPWFGIRMTKPRGSGLTQASLDRIDNSRGYTRDNVRLSSRAANTARNAASEEEFMNFLDLVKAQILRES